MGDHLDYHDYCVITMTTHEGTQILAARNGRNEIRIVSKDPDEQYPAKEATILLPSNWAGTKTPEWHDYVLCGWKAVMDYIGDIQIGFDMLVHERIPKSCGAGSTTSLVVASALTTWAISTNEGFDGITREEFAELCFISRRYLGAGGTGVDEAAVILPYRENGLYVSPSGCRQVCFDPDCAMYITRPENFSESVN
ncbi:GHMP kinase protein [Ancylostoma caninum]|uniref:GHMP kinase protein n=1 Tax=Ancylostoma caninum TaxID=29170 RepID=A0A368GKW2_ANCCA|nr:GHMP kinase protein [Ancylostoma caninum]